METLPSGVSIDTSTWAVTILTTKEMNTESNYMKEFIVKYSVSNKNKDAPHLAVTESSQFNVKYLD